MSTQDASERYVMEENDGELQRLGDQHVVLKNAIGTLILAPVDFSKPGLRILDSGTADGLWLRDLQQTVGGLFHEYFGTDAHSSADVPSIMLLVDRDLLKETKSIVPAFFPKQSTTGITFYTQSITQDWPENWLSSFDYVHQRLTLAGAGQSPVVDYISRLVQLVSPGGWIEIMEADFTRQSPNGPAMREFESRMRQFLDAVSVGFEYGRPLQALLKNYGVADVREKVFDIPYGAACTDAEVSKKSISHLMTASKGLWEFTRGHASTTSNSNDLQKFLCEAKKELEDQGAHFKIVAVWGRVM